jgi:signal transduction histidine kinase
MTRGLMRRTVIASALLAVLVGAGFAVLLRAIQVQRDAAARTSHSQDVLASANQLERLVLDLETGQRGFLITHRDRFLAPWEQARRELPGATSRFVRLAAVVPAQERRARAIVGGIDSYVDDYAIPLLNQTRRGLSVPQTATALDAGKQRVDALRGQFDRFLAAERALFNAQEDRSEADTRRAIAAAGAGLAGSFLLVALFAVYMTRAVALPVRRAAAMAERVAGGDFAVRMPEGGAGEIGTLERSFNTMAGSLEASRDELRMLAEEQAALRRVATLVARAVPASTLFEAAASEVRRILGADSTRLLAWRPDGTAVGLVGPPEPEPQPSPDSAAGIVVRTGRPARVRDPDGARTEVGAPIVVEGRLWGVMLAAFEHDDALASDTEERMGQFTELVATAIANASSRAQLARSRARVVATADETRRRIERDLHDGAQQSLTHTVITLKLAQRSLGDDDGPAAGLVDEALGHAERATGELRDLAHGILPAVLTRGGLRAGVDTLVSRLRLPVSVDVTPDRFAPALEATAYFIVAEALTNVVKHAQAEHAAVRAFADDGVLHVEIRDDGVGGAGTGSSSGLLGLHDRAGALNGDLTVESPPGAGTVVSATLPISEPPAPAGVQPPE